MKLNKFAVAAMVAGMGLSAGAMAATQGTVGATSQGDLLIEVTVPALIRITDLADINLGTYNGDGVDRTGTSPACVRRNNAGTYGIVATSANGSFTMVPDGAAATTVAYTVSWGGAPLTYNTNLPAQVADSATLGACAPVAGKLSVTAAATALDAAEPDRYTDTLILTVTPE